MIFLKTKIQDLYVVELEPKKDSRGYFQRSYCFNEFAKQGIDFKIVQTNQSMSLKKGTIRGIHMQRQPKSEDKLVQCIKGLIYDVAIDFRKDSPTFGQWVGNLLSQENNKMIFIPKGVMHGYQVLGDNVIVQYPVSEFYAPEYAVGLRWNDPYFNIKWPIKNPILSEQDKNWPFFVPKK